MDKRNGMMLDPRAEAELIDVAQAFRVLSILMKKVADANEPINADGVRDLQRAYEEIGKKLARVLGDEFAD